MAGILFIKFLPQRSGDIIREVIHQPAGDGGVGAEDEEVVNFAVALHPATRTVQPLDIQKPLIDSMGERQLAVHIASALYHDIPGAEKITGPLADGRVDGKSLVAQHSRTLLGQDIPDKPFPNTHHSKDISTLYPHQPPKMEDSGAMSTVATARLCSTCQR